ncbi:MAG: GlxA family transcriptional regulator [Oceanospirillaceae bacterium]|nr:GlxA family transcriptional regulator [Oceanospirillaceae bacterium]
MAACSASPLIPDDDGVVTLSFLLLPDYGMVSLMSAIEPLRIANRLAGRALYRWQCLSEDGQAVVASNGMVLQDHLPLCSSPAPRNLFVNASFHPERHSAPDMLNWLRLLRRRGSLLGALDTGCYPLARAGLLKGYQVTMHWEAAPAFQALYPDVPVSPELYEIDRGLITCAGGAAATDLMLHLIGQHAGPDLCARICDQTIRSAARPPSERQCQSLAQRHRIHHPRLRRVLDLMEQHLDMPLAPETLAQRAHISLRQLERLCQRYLNASPSQYYLGLRLERARQLLRESDLSIASVASACGFSTASHFCHCYRRRFGLTPGAQRREAA